jgi:ketosteroid isomerase-like protein
MCHSHCSQNGIEAYRQTWELFFSSNQGGDGSFNLEDLTVTASNTVAYAHGLLRIAGSKEPVCRLSIGLRKIRGKWLIAHEHHSYPYEE